MNGYKGNKLSLKRSVHRLIREDICSENELSLARAGSLNITGAIQRAIAKFPAVYRHAYHINNSTAILLNWPLTLIDIPGPISTPNSSSCAKIATNTYSRSQVSIKPTKVLAPLEKKIIPLELGIVFYKNRGGDYKDVSLGAIKALADIYCKANLPIKMKSNSLAFSIIKSNLYYY
ncbi:unnamed protein product [Fusarium fujikuroi]|uniref:Uncharacterized protein n=1 Tax=Fusarium fujikuroi TaxID=5127 RepID=A0A9Q9UEH8_FUSFU|nr:unnamed protein product [Fusarium fujikuroi]